MKPNYKSLGVTRFLSVIRHEGKLYLLTYDGLYGLNAGDNWNGEEALRAALMDSSEKVEVVCNIREIAERLAS